MNQEVLKIAATQGVWAVLFVCLLFYVLRENSNREAKYQDILDKLSDKFGVVEDIKQDVKEIKEKLWR